MEHIVTTLTIRMAAQDTGKVARETQEIEVTHLLAREVSVGELTSYQAATPGVVVLLSQFENYTLNIDSKATFLVPGLAYLLRGKAKWRLSPFSGRNEAKSGKASVLMIQVNALINKAFPLPELLTPPTQLDATTSEEIERLYGGLSTAMTPLILPAASTDVARNMAAARLVLALLGSTGAGRAREREALTDPRLVALKQFMFAHLADNSSIDEMARHAGLSRSGLYRWATPLLGASPMHYLRTLRLEKAHELLSNTGLSIDEVAEKSGFVDRYHLSKEFAKQYQIAPARMRRTVQRRPVSELLAKVDLLISTHCFDEAISLCDNNLRQADLSGSHTRLHYQRAQCLYGLGRIDEAQEVWESLGNSEWSYGAGKQLCGLYFRRARYDCVLDHLAALYPNADEGQQRELLLIWSHHVSELITRRLVQPLQNYLELRNRLFPDNLRCMTLTSEVLFGLGQEHLAPELCPNLRESCFFGLRRAGLYRRAIAEYGGDVDPKYIPITLLMFGQYEEVMKVAADNPEIMAAALSRLGRPEEAIRHYPDHCQEAYLELARYQELLDHWTEPSGYQVHALFALNRTESLLNYPKSDSGLWLVAQFLAGPENILRLPSADPTLYHRALLWNALQHLTAGEPGPAGESLGRIPLVQSPNFWWPDHDGVEVLFGTITRGLLGQRDVMQSELEAIRDKHKYTNWQRIWHDASFLLGDIDAEQYRRQPCAARLEQRLALVSSIDADLKGHRSKAVQHYRTFIAPHKGVVLTRLELRKFINWRLTCLGQ